MRVGKLRVLGGDYNVGGERELEAAGDRIAIDRGDDRLFHPLDHRDEGRAALFADSFDAQFVEVEPGAERAPGAGDDHHADLRIGAQLLHRAAETSTQLAVERVELFGAVERDGRNTVIFRYQNERLAHRGGKP